MKHHKSDTHQENLSKERQAFKKAFDAFATTFAQEIGMETHIAKSLRNTANVHSTLLLIGPGPISNKSGIIVKFTVEFSEVLSPQQIKAITENQTLPQAPPDTTVTGVFHDTSGIFKPKS